MLSGVFPHGVIDVLERFEVLCSIALKFLHGKRRKMDFRVPLQLLAQLPMETNGFFLFFSPQSTKQGESFQPGRHPSCKRFLTSHSCPYPSNM